MIRSLTFLSFKGSSSILSDLLDEVSLRSEGLSHSSKRTYYNLDHIRKSFPILMGTLILKHRKSKDGWFSLHSTLLQKMSKSYYKAFRVLVESGVLVSDWCYVVGSKCYGYRFSDSFAKKYLNKDNLFLKVLTDEWAISRFVKFYVDSGVFTIPSTGLCVDMDLACDIVCRHLKNGTIDNEQAGVAMLASQAIFEEDFFSRVDNFSGRVHTNVTNLPSYLRAALSFGDGKPLCNVDVNNSQPLCLSALFDKNVVKRLSDEAEDGFFSDAEWLYPYSGSDDTVKFINLCRNGTIYEHLAERLTVALGRNVSRKEAKQSFIKWLFVGSSDFSWFGDKMLLDMNDMVSYLFPSVHKGVNSVRQNCGYAAMARLLQRVETHLVIKNIVPILLDRGIDHMTIHDSVLCRLEDSDKVKSVMEEVYSVYGIKVAIGVDDYSKAPKPAKAGGSVWDEFVSDFERNGVKHNVNYILERIGVRKNKKKIRDYDRPEEFSGFFKSRMDGNYNNPALFQAVTNTSKRA